MMATNRNYPFWLGLFSKSIALLGLVTLLLFSWKPAQANFQPQLTRYPYLTDLVGSYATINFATDQSQATAAVKYGQVGVESCTAHTVQASANGFVVAAPGTVPVSEYQWKALLNLQLGAQYCYRVFLGSNPQIDLLGTDPSPVFWTQVPAGSTQPFSFAVFGDWGGVEANGLNPYQAMLLSNLAKSGARFALTAGDNVYSTTGTTTTQQTQYGDLYQSGAGTSAVFGGSFWKLPGAGMAIFPALGNHGFSSLDPVHPHILNFPQDRAVSLSKGRYTVDLYQGYNATTPANYPSAWYAFDAGIARFYVLEAAWPNSNVGTADLYKNDYDYHWQAGSPEIQWLAADLHAHKGGLKFAVVHFPLYSDNNTEDSDTWLQGVNSLEGLLQANGVQIVFNGHAHVYERNLPSNGLVTYITGGGGARLEPIGVSGCSAFDAFAIGWSYSSNAGSACGSASVPADIRQVFHYLLVTVNGPQVQVNPVNALGNHFDGMTYSYTGLKESSPPSVPAALKITSSSTTSITLSWQPSTDNVAVRGYTLYRNGALWAVIDASTSSYKDDTLQPGTGYLYRVDAFDGWGNHSGLSNPVQIGQASPPPKSIFIPLIMK